MYGENDDESTAVDVVMGTIDDVWPQFRIWLRDPDEQRRVGLLLFIFRKTFSFVKH